MRGLGGISLKCIVFGMMIFILPFHEVDLRAEIADRIVAIVNDDIITEVELRSYLGSLMADEGFGPLLEAQPDEAVGIALGRLIERQLVLQEAEEMGLGVESDELVGQLDTMRRRFGSDAAFRQALAESGLTKEKLKEQSRKQLLMQKVIAVAVRSKILVSPEEIARELVRHPEVSTTGDRVEVWHILVRVNASRSKSQAQALAEKIYQDLEGGADFNELAKRFSEDSHAQNGGAMGWVAKGTLLPELDSATSNMKQGELSMPIQTRLGFHIVKVGDRRLASSLSVLEAHQAIERQLYELKFQQALKNWFTELKKRAYIEVRGAIN